MGNCLRRAISWMSPCCNKMVKYWLVWQSGQVAGSFWPRKHFPTMISIRSYGRIWTEQKPVGCMKPGWAQRKCRGRRSTFSVRPIGRRSLTNCCAMPATSSSTPPASWSGTGHLPEKRGRASDCVSIRSSPPRRIMLSTIPAPLAAGWELPAPSGTPECPGRWLQCWTDYISTPCASRIPMRWRSH